MMSKGIRNVQLSRSQELLGERGPKTRHAVRFEDMPDLLSDALKVAKNTAIAEAPRAASEAKGVYGTSSIAISDVLVSNGQNQANPRTVLSQTVLGFKEGGFIATFKGYFDNTHVNRSFGNLTMLINGTQVDRTRIGLRFTDPADGIGSMVPFTLTCVFNTPDAEPTVSVQAYAFDADDETTATTGFYIRSGRLVISGAQ